MNQKIALFDVDGTLIGCEHGIIEITKGVKKALDTYRHQVKYMNDVLRKTTKEGEEQLRVDGISFSRCIVGEEYFIAITEESAIITKSTDPGSEEMNKEIEKLRDFIGGNFVRVHDCREYLKEKDKNIEGRKSREIVYEGGGSYGR